MRTFTKVIAAAALITAFQAADATAQNAKAGVATSGAIMLEAASRNYS